jgi:hypothetical protein
MRSSRETQLHSNKKCATAVAIGFSRSVCQATTFTFATRRPSRVIVPAANVSVGRPERS